MATLHRVVLTGIVLGCVSLSACHGPRHRTASGHSEPLRASHVPPEVLEKLLALDREAVALGSQRVARLHALLDNGRVDEMEVLDAELALLDLQRQLILREHEWAEARSAGGR